MPLYTFKNTETGETTDLILSVSAMEQYKVDNPQMQNVIYSPGLIGGRDQSGGGNLPDGFKDKLREIKKKHPGSTGVDHLI